MAPGARTTTSGHPSGHGERTPGPGRRVVARPVAVCLTLCAGLIGAPPGQAAGSTTRPSPPAGKAASAAGPDYDGDGIADHAVSADDAVVVRYGDGGYRVMRSAVPGGAFGDALASGDFDGDGYTDLAVGAPLQSTPTLENSGAVWVYRGGPGGLATAAPAELHQGRPMPGTAWEPLDLFGAALAAGDLTGDGRADLVVGSPGEAIGDRSFAGLVTVVPGSPSGPAPAAARSVSQNTAGVAGSPERDDEFGSGVAVGDVTGDGRADLVVAATGENGSGIVHLLPGTAGGLGTLSGTGGGAVTAAALGVRPSPLSVLYPGISGDSAFFGRALAVADLTGDGRAEVLVGAPLASVAVVAAGPAGGATPDARVPACGAVTVLRGASTGLAAVGAQLITQATPGVAGGCEASDFWGWDLAAGDLTGDGRPEVVVGAQGESIGSVPGSGGYTVLRSTSGGVTGDGSFGVHQDSSRVPGAAEAWDAFAASVAVQDVDRDGRGDVIVGVPGELVRDEAVGAVTTLLSAPTGRPAAGSRSVSGAALPDARGPLDHLGLALSAGRTAGAPGTAGRSTGAGAPGAARPAGNASRGIGPRAVRR